MRILRIADCGSLSGRSTLTYHIGCSEARHGISEARHGCSESGGVIHIRLFANTAKGYFCKDWIAMPSIEVLLAENATFSSGEVQRLLFEGKSINSGGFLLAALRHEGLIRTSPGSLRSYEPLDSTAWQLEVLALMEAGVALSEHQGAVVPVQTQGKGKKTKASTPKPTKPKTAMTPMAA